MTHHELSSWLEEPGEDSPLAGTSAAGKRIVIVIDGGRLRERVDKRGRKRSNGSRGFSTDWVEPRQLVVYAIDEKGKQTGGYTCTRNWHLLWP